MFLLAKILNTLNATPGSSFTPIKAIRATSLSAATPLTSILSIFVSSLTIVPSDVFKLERTTNCTPYFFASSTERL